MNREARSRITPSVDQIVLFLILGGLYGTVTFLIWKPYGGVMACVLWGVATAVAGLIPAQRYHSVASSMAVGAFLGIAMLAVTAGEKGIIHEGDWFLIIVGILMWGILGGLLGLFLGVGLSLVRAKLGNQPLSIGVGAAVLLLAVGLFLGLFNCGLGAVVCGISVVIIVVKRIRSANSGA